jgi:tRNA1Val (adenine37-N6)-methyltransferase
MINSKNTNSFTFKQFTIKQDITVMKVNTDGVLLGAWADVSDVKNVLDIGTGTGVIALMIAQRAQSAKIIGIDIDQNSCDEAQENVNASIFSNKVKIGNISIQDFANISSEKFDLIISNPPFFTGGTFSANENKANVRHTIKLPHGDLLKAVNQLLYTEGKFSVILPFLEGLRFTELAERSGLYLIKETKVRHQAAKNIERLLLTFSKQSKEKSSDELCIMDEDNKSYSNEFVALTKDFYKNM